MSLTAFQRLRRIRQKEEMTPEKLTKDEQGKATILAKEDEPKAEVKKEEVKKKTK